MNPKLIKDAFRARVCEQIDLEEEGINRFRVFTPFRFEDGDHFVVVLKNDGNRWILTDEAHTLMHLSYWLDEEDLESGNRHEIIEGSLAVFSVENRNGELVIPVPDERFGDALFNFIQALTKVTDLAFLSRERVKSTFMEDFKVFLTRAVPKERITFDWTDSLNDPSGHYPVDCRINHMKDPLFVYALPNDNRVRDATISLLKFEQWGLEFHSIGIFEQHESISRQVLARFTDVCEKAFTTLGGDNTKRIHGYLDRLLKKEDRKVLGD
jgi:hypothetical protein